MAMFKSNFIQHDKQARLQVTIIKMVGLGLEFVKHYHFTH